LITTINKKKDYEAINIKKNITMIQKIAQIRTKVTNAELYSEYLAVQNQSKIQTIVYQRIFFFYHYYFVNVGYLNLHLLH
jgi:hypothetical protein